MNRDPKTFYETWAARMTATKERAPELGKAFAPFFRDLMKDGALDSRTKELLAVALAVGLRCESCIFAHVEKAFKAGCSSEEIMEAVGVAVMMGGGPAYVYAPVVAEALSFLEQRAAQT